jgi:phage/plasmid primase-like uncharacterized protein
MPTANDSACNCQSALVCGSSATVAAPPSAPDRHATRVGAVDHATDDRTQQHVRQQLQSDRDAAGEVEPVAVDHQQRQPDHRHRRAELEQEQRQREADQWAATAHSTDALPAGGLVSFPLARSMKEWPWRG